MPAERQTKNVARKQRSGFRVSFVPHCSPDYATLHPGYPLSPSLLSSGEVAEGSRGGQDAAKQLLAGETKVCEANLMSIPIGVRQGIRAACCPPVERRVDAAKRAPCKGEWVDNEPRIYASRSAARDTH
jgi:hypothetical protein